VLRAARAFSLVKDGKSGTVSLDTSIKKRAAVLGDLRKLANPGARGRVEHGPEPLIAKSSTEV
jgi:hypothetical protein